MKARIEAMAILLEQNVIELNSQRHCLSALVAAQFDPPGARELRKVQDRARRIRAARADEILTRMGKAERLEEWL